MKCPLIIVFIMMFGQISYSQSMIVKIEGLHESKGQILAFLFNNEDDFPTKKDRAFKTEKFDVTSSSMFFSFKDVPSGVYGVAVYHDENSNGKMDRNWYGTPKEGYGASNDATGSLGPPKFKDAKFDFKNSQDTVKIIIHY